MATLRKRTGHTIGLPAPAWLLEAGAALTGTGTVLILKSRWAKPARLMAEGFQFKYQKIEDALKAIINNTPRKNYHLF
jgi:NAD dependent epimerase/dehydratase family enzyme